MNFKLIAYIIACIIIGTIVVSLAVRVAAVGAVLALVVFFGLIGYGLYRLNNHR